MMVRTSSNGGQHQGIVGKFGGLRRGVRLVTATSIVIDFLLPTCHRYIDVSHPSRRFSMANDLDFAALSAVLDGLLDAPAPPLDDLRPLLLERSPMRARLRDHHQSQVSMLDEALARVRGAERKLALLRNNLILRRRAFASAISPILALPDELLERILELVVFPPRIPWGRPSRAITVSHVCSRWRSVATSMSRFWTDLDITSLAKSDLISAFAERSGSLRLDLSFPHPNDDFPAFEPERNFVKCEKPLLGIREDQ